MSPSNEHIGSKILAKIKIYILTRGELLFTLCYEIPCIYICFKMYEKRSRFPTKLCWIGCTIQQANPKRLPGFFSLSYDIYYLLFFLQIEWIICTTKSTPNSSQLFQPICPKQPKQPLSGVHSPQPSHYICLPIGMSNYAKSL